MHVGASKVMLSKPDMNDSNFIQNDQKESKFKLIISKKFFLIFGIMICRYADVLYGNGNLKTIGKCH